jgi:hypothetical protein
MKETVSKHEFVARLGLIRPDNFSYEGREVLWSYLDQLETDMGEEMEFDPIAFCCEYAEDTIENIISYYGIEDKDLETWEDKKDEVLMFLEDNTSVCGMTDKLTVVYQQF